MSWIEKRADDERELLAHAYSDDELDAAGILDAERMIEADAAFARLVTSARTLQITLRREFPPEPLPSHLRSRIDTAVGPQKKTARPAWALLAASIVVAIVLSSSITWLVLRHVPETNILVAELVDSHMRALSATQSIDIASSDRHTVKPWFNGKITQSPKVVDLSQAGFPLIGGRIDIFGKNPAPTLVYSRRRHLISLTAVSRFNGAAHISSPRSVNGFNIVSWTVGETTYWAVSDLNVTELDAFAKLFQQAT